MNSNLKIRSALPEDSSSVFSLAKAMATSFEVVKGPFDQSFFEILKNPSAICIVAEIEKQIVGYLIGFDHRAFYANGRVSWVEEIFVQQDRRQEGIGIMLIDRFEEWSIKRESKLVGLATRRASNFYEAIGYEESATFYRKLLNHKSVQIIATSPALEDSAFEKKL